MNYTWDFGALLPYWPLLLKGFLTTCLFTILTVVAGVAIGLVVGLLRLNSSRFISWPLTAYVEVFRCTPLLVQLVWFYYALPVILGVSMSASTAAFLALALYGGSFYSEIFRGGINAVDRGQWEAGHAIGLAGGKIFRRIVLPQAVRIMIPAFINQIVMQLKNTSLVSTVAVGDLLYQGSVITSTTYRPLEVYTVVAIIYFLILFPLTLFSRVLERRLEVR